jgi:hypothetical protein
VWDERRRSDPAVVARYVAERLPAGHFQTPETIANAADICGSVVVVDAGRSRAFPP